MKRLAAICLTVVLTVGSSPYVDAWAINGIRRPMPTSVSAADFSQCALTQRLLGIINPFGWGQTLWRLKAVFKKVIPPVQTRNQDLIKSYVQPLLDHMPPLPELLELAAKAKGPVDPLVLDYWNWWERNRDELTQLVSEDKIPDNLVQSYARVVQPLGVHVPKETVTWLDFILLEHERVDPAVAAKGYVIQRYNTGVRAARGLGRIVWRDQVIFLDRPFDCYVIDPVCGYVGSRATRHQIRLSLQPEALHPQKVMVDWLESMRTDQHYWREAVMESEKHVRQSPWTENLAEHHIPGLIADYARRANQAIPEPSYERNFHDSVLEELGHAEELIWAENVDKNLPSRPSIAPWFRVKIHSSLGDLLIDVIHHVVGNADERSAFTHSPHELVPELVRLLTTPDPVLGWMLMLQSALLHSNPEKGSRHPMTARNMADLWLMLLVVKKPNFQERVQVAESARELATEILQESFYSIDEMIFIAGARSPEELFRRMLDLVPVGGIVSVNNIVRYIMMVGVETINYPKIQAIFNQTSGAWREKLGGFEKFAASSA